MARLDDERFMRAALAFARRGLGQTAPNPTVAALVVDETCNPPVVLGRGRTALGGRPHAEAIAIDAAGARAKGATLYVTLEPCATRSSRHFGPSCSELILQSGLKRVVIAADDPSAFAAGIGAQSLRDAGLNVQTGVLAQEAHALNLGHILRINAHRPLVQVKLAQTPDGFAATRERKPVAITGMQTRAYVHRLRGLSDALITGIETILADDPLLSVRLPGMEAQTPLRIVLDTMGRMPRACAMIESAATKPVLLATAQPDVLASRFADVAGVEVMGVPQGADGHLDLKALLAALAARGITRVMVEAGPVLANAFAQAGLLDELVLLTGATPLGEGLKAILPGLQGWIDAGTLAQTWPIEADLCQIYTGAL